MNCHDFQIALATCVETRETPGAELREHAELCEVCAGEWADYLLLEAAIDELRCQQHVLEANLVETASKRPETEIRLSRGAGRFRFRVSAGIGFLAAACLVLVVSLNSLPLAPMNRAELAQRVPVNTVPYEPDGISDVAPVSEIGGGSQVVASSASEEPVQLMIAAPGRVSQSIAAVLLGQKESPHESVPASGWLESWRESWQPIRDDLEQIRSIWLPPPNDQTLWKRPELLEEWRYLAGILSLDLCVRTCSSESTTA